MKASLIKLINSSAYRIEIEMSSEIPEFAGTQEKILDEIVKCLKRDIFGEKEVLLIEEVKGDE